MFANSEAKEKSLNDVMGALNKKFGKVSPISFLPEAGTAIERFHSGSLSIDYVCGDKEIGLPRGRTITIYGPSSGGKTTVALAIGKAVQDSGGTVAIVDVEMTITQDYCESVGMDTSKLVYVRPETGEDAADIVINLARSGAVDLIILDSLNALTPTDSVQKSFNDSERIGSQAALASRLFRDITSPLNETGCTFVAISQTRANMNKDTPYSPDEVMAGAKAVSFYSSIILKVSRKAKVKQGADVIGNDVRVMVEKNKTGAPGRVADVRIYFGKGVSPEYELLDLGERYGVVKRGGAKYVYKTESGEEELIGFGREASVSKLETDTVLSGKIRHDILSKSGYGVKDVGKSDD